jgi:hypothetical protein
MISLKYKVHKVYLCELWYVEHVKAHILKYKPECFRRINTRKSYAEKGCLKDGVVFPTGLT